jgi:hypothetical protein
VATPEICPAVPVTPLTVCVVAFAAPPTVLPTPPSKPSPPEALETLAAGLERPEMSGFDESPTLPLAAARVNETIIHCPFCLNFQNPCGL